MPEPVKMSRNTAFSEIVPNLQLAWDSTSLGAFKECPRKYEYSIVKGYQPRALSVHLIFGLHYHSSLEAYDHARSAGADHKTALRAAVKKALSVTWDSVLGRPWTSDDKNKNRETLLRSIVWYLDQFANDPLETVQLANGKPAVELSFRWQSSYETQDKEPFLICGHLDRVAKINGKAWIVDRKTTKSTISSDFFAKFTPDNQFTIYTLSAFVVYNMPVEGIICDGAQIAVTFSRFERQPVPRHKSQIEEWYQELGQWLLLAESYARQGHWPMNDKSCGNYGGCQFREVCSMAPSDRERWLESKFTKRIWDPLQVRGDI